MWCQPPIPSATKFTHTSNINILGLSQPPKLNLSRMAGEIIQLNHAQFMTKKVADSKNVTDIIINY